MMKDSMSLSAAAEEEAYILEMSQVYTAWGLMQVAQNAAQYKTGWQGVQNIPLSGQSV
jgi:hypothetical protein